MFWKSKNPGAAVEASKKRLPGPKPIVEKVGRSLIVDQKQNPDWVWQLQSVICPDESSPKKINFRVFDPSKTLGANFKLHDFHSFDDHPEFVLWQGWYSKDDFHVYFNDQK